MSMDGTPVSIVTGGAQGIGRALASHQVTGRWSTGVRAQRSLPHGKGWGCVPSTVTGFAQCPRMA